MLKTILNKLSKLKEELQALFTIGKYAYYTSSLVSIRSKICEYAAGYVRKYPNTTAELSDSGLIELSEKIDHILDGSFDNRYSFMVKSRDMYLLADILKQDIVLHCDIDMDKNRLHIKTSNENEAVLMLITDNLIPSI